MTGTLTPAEMDAEMRAAIEALVYRLRNPEPGTEPLGVDAGPFADEFMRALWQRGWRPVLAVPASANWRAASGADPGAYERGGALWREMYANRKTTVPGQGAETEETSNEQEEC